MDMIAPSQKMNEMMVNLSIIAAYAKVAQQEELYNQAKEAYENIVKQYYAQRERYVPKKKSFWSTLLRDENVPVFYPVEALEDSLAFTMAYERGMKLSKYELGKEMKEVLAMINRTM